MKAEETGSVAMNTVPRAQPPSTMCQYHGTANIGLVSEPERLSTRDIAIVPTTTPVMVLPEPTCVHNNIAHPI